MDDTIGKETVLYRGKLEMKTMFLEVDPRYGRTRPARMLQFFVKEQRRLGVIGTCDE